MTRHTIPARLVIHDADDNELARVTLQLTVAFTPGYPADDTDPGTGDLVELLRIEPLEAYPVPALLLEIAQAYIDAHHDEIAAQCREDGKPDADRMREDSYDREKV